MFEYIKKQPHYNYTVIDENKTEYKVNIKTNFGSLFENVVVVRGL